MRTIELNKLNEIFELTAMGLGNFDGLHIGHQNLIKDVIKQAKKENYKSSVLLFRNHTKLTVEKKAPPKLLSLDEKLLMLEKMGLDMVYLCDFSTEMMNMSGADFVKFLKFKLNVRAIIVGNDYRFGYKRKSDVKDLLNFCNDVDIKLIITGSVLCNNELVSSSLVRNSIIEGNISKANHLLGYCYGFNGRVIHGKGIGGELGFPTANIELYDNKLIPADGVYITSINIDDTDFLSCTSIGKNPTFNEKNRVVETHILDYDEDIYDRNVRITFIEYIRGQQKFNNISDLLMQINRDIEITKSKYK